MRVDYRLRPRDPRYINPNDRCLCLSVGRYRVWLGRGMWRIDKFH